MYLELVEQFHIQQVGITPIFNEPPPQKSGSHIDRAHHGEKQ